MYKSYVCEKCHKTCILLKEEIVTARYLKCPHCSSKNIHVEKESDNLKECMSEHRYKREHGALRQVK